MGLEETRNVYLQQCKERAASSLVAWFSPGPLPRWLVVPVYVFGIFFLLSEIAIITAIA